MNDPDQGRRTTDARPRRAVVDDGRARPLVDPRGFRDEEAVKAGLRRVLGGAYNGDVPIAMGSIARRSAALRQQHQEERPDRFATVSTASISNWTKSNRPLPVPTAPGGLRSFLALCRVPDDEIDAWVDALVRVRSSGPVEPPPEPAAQVVDESEPADGDPGPSRARAFPDPPVDPGPPPVPRQRLLIGLVAVATGGVLGAVARFQLGPGSGIPAPGLWPVGAGVLILAALLGPWLSARLSYDPGVPLEQTLQRWAANQERRWTAELENRQRWIDPTLRVGWNVTVPSADDWRRHVAVADRPGPGTGGSWARPGSLTSGEGPIADVLLDAVPARRLLLVGQPGAGKSVLLLDLALRMNERATAGADSTPWPVLLSMASWQRTGEDTRLEDWLEHRLVLDDPWLGRRATGFDPSVAAVALQTGRILPVLDGLDEIGDAAAQSDALARIDDWLRQARRPGIVVATRPGPDPSRPAGPLPRLMLVGEVEPLGVGEVREYLAANAGGDVWHDVLRDEPPTPVVTVMRRPLGVSLAATVYQPPGTGARQDPKELLRVEPDGDRPVDAEHAVMRTLIRRFLPAAFERRPHRDWTPDRAVTWLRTVAGFTSKAAGSAWDQLVWWELWRRAGWLVAIVLGLPGAVAVGVVAGLDTSLGMGLGCGILVGVAAVVVTDWALKARDASDDFGPGVAIGFFCGLLGAAAGGVVAVAAGLDDTPWRGLMGALGAGIAAGGAGRTRTAAAAGGLLGGVAVALTANAGAGLAAGIVDGLGAWAAGAAVIKRAGGRPAKRLNRPKGWIVAGVALPCGLAIGARVASALGPAAGVVAGLVIGVLGGVAAGCSAAAVPTNGYAGDPHTVLAADRATFWQMFLFGGLTFGCGAAVAVNWRVGAAAFVTVGLIAGATRSAWPAFVVARICFAVRGRLPLRLMEFLDEAYTRGLLRRNGAGYQVRHQEIAEYLVADDQPTTAK